MIALNLEATNTEHIILKDYLESNVSEILAEKINNGVRLEKDGKTLINKKDLTAFMNYACEEARKQADKGARAACIDHTTVFGWAVHYFEEDSIEGTLYNEDGTEYTPPKAAVKPSVKPAKIVPAAKSNTQASFFDMLDTTTVEAAEAEHQAPEVSEPNEEHETDEAADSEQDLEIDEALDAVPEIPTLRQIDNNSFVDQDGVVQGVSPTPHVANNPVTDTLKKLLGDVKVRCA